MLVQGCSTMCEIKNDYDTIADKTRKYSHVRRRVEALTLGRDIALRDVPKEDFVLAFEPCDFFGMTMYVAKKIVASSTEGEITPDMVLEKYLVISGDKFIRDQ